MAQLVPVWQVMAAPLSVPLSDVIVVDENMMLGEVVEPGPTT